MSLTLRRPALVRLSLATILAVGSLGALADWQAFLRGWLAAVLTWSALPLGAMAVIMTHGLTGGRWGTHSLPVWRALVSTTPLLVVGMVPLLFGLDELFRWTHPEETLPEVVRHKLLYLNKPFFIVRTAIYAVLWLVLAGLLRTGVERGARLHAPGLILWLMSVTFFGFDWFMSLEPTFYSDVFGLSLAAAAVGAAMAAGFLLGAGRRSPGVTRDLIGLWLSVVMGWVFLAFSQYIVIWHGNLPHEIGWYVHRSDGIWRGLSWVIFFLFCAGPVIALFSNIEGGRRPGLTLGAIVSLIGYILHIQWLVLPAFAQAQPQPVLYWFTPIAVVALGAVYASVASASLKRTGDPNG